MVCVYEGEGMIAYDLMIGFRWGIGFKRILLSGRFGYMFCVCSHCIWMVYIQAAIRCNFYFELGYSRN